MENRIWVGSPGLEAAKMQLFELASKESVTVTGIQWSYVVMHEESSKLTVQSREGSQRKTCMIRAAGD